MAATTNLLFAFSVVTILVALVHSRGSPTNTQTATLDVTGAISKTHHAISPDIYHHQYAARVDEAFFVSNITDAITLAMHSRDALLRSHLHRDYRSLTLVPLGRDAARVKALNAKLKNALKLVGAEDEDLEGPIVSGNSQGSGEYFSRVGVGKPAAPQYMVLDTGSDVTWVQCRPCSECYSQTDPIYDPALSSTYSSLTCASPQCKWLDASACRRDDVCLYRVSYGDGSYSIGDLVTETVAFGPSAAGEVSIALGCGHDNEGLFVGAGGLLGLGGGALSFPSQIKSAAFSYCLVDRDSSAASTLAFGPGAAAPAGASVSAPLLRNPKFATFYYVGMAGISVGGRALPIPPSAFAVDESGSGGVIVDSGTSVTRLQTGAYNALRDEILRMTTGLPRAAGVAIFDTCFDLSKHKSVQVPTLAFHFGAGQVLHLPAKNYLIPVDSSGTFCLALAPTSQPLSIVGNVQQQGIRVSFDLGNSQIVFAPNKC